MTSPLIKFPSRTLNFGNPGLKAVLFDLDGTLVDAFDDIAAAANHVRKGMGLEPLSVDEVKKHVGHGARHLVAGVTGLPPGSEELEQQFGHLLRFYENHPASLAKPFPQAVDCLHALKQAGLALGICTNKPHAVTLALLNELQLTSFFASILGEQSGLPAKPDPTMVFRACEVMGVTPEEAVFVGDSPVDIVTARHAGVPVIVLTHGAHSEEELVSHGPDLVLPGFPALLDLLNSQRCTQ